MSTHIAPGFEASLAPHFQVADLEREPAVVFGLHADLTIAYFNSAWTAFAGANRGQLDIAHRWGLGARYLDAVPASLREFYRALLARAPEPGAALHPVTHRYECSSPTLFREFSMQVYALPRHAGFVVVNSLIFEAPHDPAIRPPHAPDPARYQGARGFIVQCAHCRRVQRDAEPAHWDWVPAWVERSPSTASHTVCDLCVDYYYAALAS